MGRFLSGLIVLIAAIFLIILLYFRIVEGSFEEAGARMDVLLGAAAEETEEAAGTIARETDEAVDETMRELNDDN
ncbi:MAG: hypothetical protein CME85_12915 [Henriciella sp.]|jgi:hypothetical protein|uniref:hypothetical protein n=1 Tax=Henriciella sp. TaxID=1968823 RepID=UPI000C0D655A|nr:hypothetical protein [Henriciella sp.]MAN75169.1 hypothetical protein [Henriciella sp.]MBF33284.1 hypothetical protein [Hyphomonadaceae bacterium]MBK76370.1 hypothetical protein [Henriciella sp.]PHR74999.1 MAG: hypothetical protein COA64_13015 [Henriciella sp.]|tara:strand:+ start:451 stop:675 length:225 start_codon:yes stop_codon:yes gene_type:complete